MYQLVQPIWLFALAALAIPVVIHLWNRRPGKTLKVGSIALVKESALAYKKRIKLSEILLLLVRCLLLACIAVAMAGSFRNSLSTSPSKGWVLMDRQQLTATYNRFKPTIDSLLQRGLEFHYFEDGFKKEKLSTALQLPPDTNAVATPAYRALATALDQMAAPRVPLYIFTDNYLRHFKGRRLPVARNLHWFTYTPDTTTLQPFTDTSTLQVTIFSRGFTNDARYVVAALDAIRQFSKRNMQVRSVSAVADIPAAQDWLFWLDDASPIPTVSTKNLLLYAKGERVKRASWILPVTASSFTPVDLYAAVMEQDSLKQWSEVLWRDGFGHPLLISQQNSSIHYYYLYTHIDPSWNDLPWSNHFPAILYQLLYKDRVAQNAAAIAARTTIDSTQLMPELITTRQAGSIPAAIVKTDLTPLLWWIVFFLFFAERCLSFYHRKQNADG